MGIDNPGTSAPSVVSAPLQLITPASTFNPTTLPNVSSASLVGRQTIAWAPNGKSVAVVLQDSPYLVVLKVNAQGQITDRYANPASLPSSLVGTGPEGVFWSPDGLFIGQVGTDPTHLIATVEIWNWSDAAGFGAKIAAPATPIAGTDAWSAEFNAAQTELLVSSQATPFLQAYAFAGGAIGAKAANPATLPLVSQGVAYWTPDDLGVITSTTEAWAFAAGAWGAKYAAAPALTNGSGEPSFWPVVATDGSYHVFFNTSGGFPVLTLIESLRFTPGVGWDAVTGVTSHFQNVPFATNKVIEFVRDGINGIIAVTDTLQYLTETFAMVNPPGFPQVGSDTFVTPPFAGFAGLYLSPNGKHIAAQDLGVPFVNMLSWMP